MLHFLSFKRPVSIGVYGHPSHEISKYTLLVSEVIVEDDTSSYDETSGNTYKTRDRVSHELLYNSIFLTFIYTYFISYERHTVFILDQRYFIFCQSGSLI